MTDSTKPSAGTGKLLATMIVAMAVSVGGIVYAVLWGTAGDGGRGGAIGVAFTFFMFFMGRGTAEQAFEAPLPDAGPEDGSDTRLAQVRGAVAAMLDWSAKEKVFLTAASVFSTMIWGFGDVIARCFGASR